MELWKDIPGFEGEYQASNLGRIKSLAKSYKTGCGYIRQVPDRIMSCNKLTPKGYMRVRIKNKTYQLHRIVALTWLNKIEGKDQVNHKDGDKTNNKIDNLEWVTNQENRDHAVKNNLIAIDKKCPHTKYSKELVLKIRELHSSGMTQYSIAKLFDLKVGYVHRVVNLKIRTRFSD